ncbi:MAG: ATP-binding cassette domain-containing protein, partial [Chloroflexi bacterium]|nr:ATP-binding cassette domain-containing protein [Chloroflexota bacterium]
MINNLIRQNISEDAVDRAKGGILRPPKCILTVEKLNAWYGNNQVIQDVSVGIGAQSITALIGPSGCGKSTFIRCLNRMHEVSEGGKVTGRVLMGGRDIY